MTDNEPTGRVCNPFHLRRARPADAGRRPSGAVLASDRQRAIWGYNFFISYHWASGGRYAVALAQQLRNKKYDCFLDRTSMPWGTTGRRRASVPCETLDAWF